MIVKTSVYTGACYRVKKCPEIVFTKGKMIKGEAWVVLEEKVIALDPNKNETYKFFGWKQADKIDVKKELRRKVDHLRD